MFGEVWGGLGRFEEVWGSRKAECNMKAVLAVSTYLTT